MNIPKTSDKSILPFRHIKIVILSLIGFLSLSGCRQLLCDVGITGQCAAYTITYTPNGADEGTVPIDSNKYQQGEVITVLPNSGGLTLSSYTFDGWNTAANGAGLSYVVGNTFTMGAANITLYAEWSEDEDSDDDEDDSDIRPDAYEPDGASQATELIPDGRIQENHTFHPTGTFFPVTTPEGTKYKGDEDNYYVDVDLDVGETATLEIRTYGDTDTFLSAYAPDGGDGIAYGQEWISATVETSGRYMVLARHLDEYEGTGEYSISALLEIQGAESSVIFLSTYENGYERWEDSWGVPVKTYSSGGREIMG